jgi:hypothetical protein
MEKGVFHMEINGLNASAPSAPQQTQQQTQAAQNEEKEQQSKLAEQPAGVFERSGGTKTDYKPDIERLNQILAEGEKQIASFRKLVESLLGKQAQKAELAWPAFTDGDKQIEIDDETRAAAQKEVEEGGYYSVENTAARLLDFAVAISGGDPSKIDLLRDAVKQGFEAAAGVWGREMPEITQQTYDAVMQGFDEWQESGDAGAISLLARNASQE